MTDHPSPDAARPDLTILETRVYRGPNVWSYEKAIHLVVDLGSLEEFPTNTLPGFTDHLLEMLPGLREHSCSRGRRGGFVERLNEGTWLGHVAEHVALALQQVVGHDIRRGKTRQVKGQPGPLQRRSTGTSTSRSASRPARLAVRLVNHLVEADPELRLGRRARGVHPARRADRVRPVDPGDPRRGGLPRHPVDPAQPALPGPARPGRPRQADPGHDDLGDQLARGRHRLRQGPHHPAARRGRPAGAQAGVGAHRGPGRQRRQADRLPGRGQAAGRQPRPRRLPRPPGRGRGPRGVPDRRGAVPARLGHRRVASSPARTTGAWSSTAGWSPSPSGCPRTSSATAPAPSSSWSTPPTPTRAAASATRRCSPGSRSTRPRSSWSREQGYEMDDVPPRARWSSWRSPATCRPAASPSTAPSRRTRRTSRSPRRPPGWSASTSPASTSSAPTSPSRSARPAARSARSTRRRASGCTPTRRSVSRSSSPSRWSTCCSRRARPSRIPIVAVTGTNGKTTTSRMIAHIFKGMGRKVGMTSTDGVVIDERLVIRADASGPAQRPDGAAEPARRLRGVRGRPRRHPARGPRLRAQRRRRRAQRAARPPRPARHRHRRAARRRQGGGRRGGPARRARRAQRRRPAGARDAPPLLAARSSGSRWSEPGSRGARDDRRPLPPRRQGAGPRTRPSAAR